MLIECLIVLPRGMMDLSVDAVGDDIDSVLMAEIESNLTTPSYENVQKTSGLNHGLISYTQLYNSPANPSSAVLFSISPRIYDSAANVDGKQLSLSVVIGYSHTERNMMEDALLFSLRIVEPALVLKPIITPSSGNGVNISLTFSHSSPPFLDTSSANAYEITAVLSPKLVCSRDVTSEDGVVVRNNTLYMSVLELGRELTVKLLCLPSSLLELGKQSEISIDLEYSSNSQNGRKRRSLINTEAVFSGLEPWFNLEVEGMDGNDVIKLNEVIEAKFVISIPVGIFPQAQMVWRSSSNLDFDIKSCTFRGENILSKTSYKSLGIESDLISIQNEGSTGEAVCIGSIKTLGDSNMDSGSLTIAVNYGVNTAIVTRDISINSPWLSAEFTAAGYGDANEVEGNDEVTVELTVFHLEGSTGDAYNVWRNISLQGARIGDEESFNTSLGKVRIT